MPWNQNTLWGWFNEILFSAVAGGSYLFVNPAFLTLFISICQHHRAFNQMYRAQINQVDRLTGIKPHRWFEMKKAFHKSMSLRISAAW